MKTIKQSLENGKDVCVLSTFECDVGTFELRYHPNDNVTYDDLLDNKSFLARKMVERLNQIYLYCESKMEND